ncbi:conserved hypothetical protein [Nostocoides japonicum T1-X7]|uniref:DUF3499 domain-containing protein n=1 Tax=Nostocoides japonicum T1-X7 TaxID=1194083 RepID=A0A077M2D9_9MICO|nr:DUF3499 domain-containing protein [Tetrasphaera japonica]CCH78395.1 conserved hypothetical protein [Tetrasphaera japonica T1-X7]
MSISRQCSRNACRRPAVATLTYVYADSTAVVGPLATYAEPHTYDLCAVHAESLTAPRGWEIVRLEGDYVEPPPTHDDLLALADAVREAGRAPVARAVPQPAEPVAGVREVLRRGHLRVLTDHDA